VQQLDSHDGLAKLACGESGLALKYLGARMVWPGHVGHPGRRDRHVHGHRRRYRLGSGALRVANGSSIVV
jgi:hypothetical protein